MHLKSDHRIAPSKNAWATPGLLVAAALFAGHVHATKLDYTANLDADAETLALRICGDAGARLDLRSASRFVVSVEPAADAQGAGRIRLTLPANRCAIITTDLRAAGNADRFRLGRERGVYYRLAADQWLWRPRQLDPMSSLRFALPAGWSASVPWRADAGGTHRLGNSPGSWPALTVFGRFAVERVVVPGGELRLAMLPLGDADARAAMRDWLIESSRRYFAAAGGLPVASPQIFVAPLPGVRSAVPWGEVQRGGAPGVLLYVGAEAGADAWRGDWTLAHELAHLQHPYLGEHGRWLAEGLGSYHQNVWRARAGHMTRDEAWQKLLSGFARGRAVGPGEALASIGRGWGTTMRVYWSGAAFWFESDLALRAAGSSLDQVLQRYRGAGMRFDRRVEPGDFIAALDSLEPRGGLQRRYDEYLMLASFPTLREARTLLKLAAPDRWPDTLPDHPILHAIFQSNEAKP